MDSGMGGVTRKRDLTLAKRLLYQIELRPHFLREFSAESSAHLGPYAQLLLGVD